MDIITFLIEVIATLTASLLVTRYLRKPLNRMLITLCGTKEGAEFWTTFSDIVLIGLPVIISLTYRPYASGAEKLFFEAVARLSGNLAGYLLVLIIVGMIISFFAIVEIVASFLGRIILRPSREEKK